MKNGKNPTREHKKLMQGIGLDATQYLVVKDLPESIEIVSRIDIKKIGLKKIRTKIIVKNNR